MKKKLILHAGPPIEWNQMCGPLRGAVLGALVFEELADNLKEAEAIIESDEIEFSPCHENGTVGPMTGVVSHSMPVFVVDNIANGNRSFSTINEGLGKALRFGAFDGEVIKKLKPLYFVEDENSLQEKYWKTNQWFDELIAEIDHKRLME